MHAVRSFVKSRGSDGGWAGAKWRAPCSAGERGWARRACHVLEFWVDFGRDFAGGAIEASGGGRRGRTATRLVHPTPHRLGTRIPRLSQAGQSCFCCPSAVFDLRSPVAHRVEFLRFLRALACPQSPELERDADSYYTNMVIGDTRFWLGEPLQDGDVNVLKTKPKTGVRALCDEQHRRARL